MNKTTTTANNSDNKISTTIPSAPKIRMTVGQHKFDSWLRCVVLGPLIVVAFKIFFRGVLAEASFVFAFAHKV